MHPSRIFDRPVGIGRQSETPPLEVVGDLPGYSPGDAYEGRLDILNAIGDCVVEVVESDFPEGTSVFVDNANDQVVVTWPAHQEAQALPLVNWNFESGDLSGWRDLRGGSWGVYVYDQHTPGHKDIPYMPPDGNRAACMEGVGRGYHTLESIRYPAQPGAPVMARSLWYQGASNKDNNDLWTAVAFYNGDSLISEVRGDRIHDRTNKRRHWSTVHSTVPAGADGVAVRLIAHRKNSRNRLINVDDVETSGISYSPGVGPETEGTYCATLLVRDSANRSAGWTGCVSDGVVPGPILLEVHTRTFTSEASVNHSVAMPPVVVAGDLLVVIMTAYTSVVNKPTGWAQTVRPGTHFGSTPNVFWKIAAGTEGGASVNFSTEVASPANVIVLRYQAGTFAVAAPLRTAAALNGVTSPAGYLAPMETKWGSRGVQYVAVALAGTPSGFTGVEHPYPDWQTVSHMPSWNSLMAISTRNIVSSEQPESRYSTIDGAGNPVNSNNILIAVNGVLGAEYTTITWSQSEVYGSGFNATTAKMRDNNDILAETANSTGAATGQGFDVPFVRADLGAVRPVQHVAVGAGQLSGWGGSAIYLRGARIETSVDGVAWQVHHTITEVWDEFGRDRVFGFQNAVDARYVRVAYPADGSYEYLALCTFRIFAPVES